LIPNDIANQAPPDRSGSWPCVLSPQYRNFGPEGFLDVNVYSFKVVSEFQATFFDIAQDLRQTIFELFGPHLDQLCPVPPTS